MKCLRLWDGPALTEKQCWVGTDGPTKHLGDELGQVTIHKIQKERSEFTPVNNSFFIVMGLALLSVRKMFLVASI